MLVADDILLFPMKGLFFLLKEVHRAALEELERSAEAVRQELSELYLALEAGRLTDAEFDAREAELLDRLDALEAADEDEPAADGEDEPPAADE